MQTEGKGVVGDSKRPQTSGTSPPRNRYDEEYNRVKTKMIDNIRHHELCIPSQKRKKSKSPMKKDIKVSFEGQEEKLLVLREENQRLKSKGQELEDDVKMIATKLKRQMAQLKKDRLISGVPGGQAINQKFDEELDRMIEENFTLQEEERNLTKAVKKLQKKRAEAQEISMSHGQSTKKSMTKKKGDSLARDVTPQKPPKINFEHSSGEFIMDARILSQNLEDQSKRLQQLRQELDMVQRASHGQIPSEDLILTLRQKELQVAQQKARLEDLQMQLHTKEQYFKDTQAYQQALVEELKGLNTEYLRLQKDARIYEEAAKESEYLQDRIKELRIERDRLQQEFDLLARQPFFKKETDQSTFKKINDLQTKVDEKDRLIQESKVSIKKFDEQSTQLKEEEKQLKNRRDELASDIENMRNKNFGGKEMNIVEIQKKIHQLDPSLFRQVMKDLQYDGDEPKWAKFDFMERMRIGPNNQPFDENDPAQLYKEIERLKLEKKSLASELEKVQNLLKVQVSIDKETAFIYQQEIEQLKHLIAQDNRRINDLNAVITQRNQKLIAITKQTASLAGTQALTREGLSRIDKEVSMIQRAHREEDMLSEFSAATNESEITPQENVFDLVISKAQLDQQKLSQIMGSKEILPSAVQTFVTVDFFNHETKHSGLSEGFEPGYQTQFSFKNNVDDFYLQYLQQNTVIVEFFLTRAQNAVKIGSAKVVLQKLIDKDTTFQTQEIVYDGGNNQDQYGGYPIGKVYFKMRMRKPLDEALRVYKQRQALKLQRDPASIALSLPGAAKPRSKIVTINVLKAIDLKRPEQPNIHAIKTSEMQPFFYFQFYTFEGCYSPVMTGSSPFFEIRKQYECEFTDQFQQYMKTQVLQIDLIDESIDLTRPDAKDFIGRVRIPLHLVFVGAGTGNDEIADSFAILDEEGRTTGHLEVKVACKDQTSVFDREGAAQDTFTISKFAEREIVNKIAAKFADSLMESIDMIFDMLIEPGSYDTQKITKFRFKDYILSISDNLREQDIDIFLKTNSQIAGKDFIELSDFRSIFEVPVQAIKSKKAQKVAEINDRYYQATKGLKQMDNMQRTASFKGGFGGIADTLPKNVPLDKSLNERATLQNPVQDGQLPQGDKPLFEFLRDKVYFVINKFREECRGEPFATFEQFRKVMIDVTASLNQRVEEEIAKLWRECNMENVFYYQEQLLKMYGTTINSTQVKQDTELLAQYVKRSQDPHVIRIKEKVQQYLIKHDFSLEHLFGFIDKDRSQTVTIEEFTRGLSEVLSADECLILFQSIDWDRNNMLTYEELVNGCCKIYASYVLHKLRQAIQGGARSGLSIDKVFQTVDDNSNGEMDISEFNQVVSLAYKELKKHEIDTLWQHFDKRGVGTITKDEFQRGLNEPLSLENSLHFSLHDFLTPLKTYLKFKKIELRTVFDLFKPQERTTITTENIKAMVRNYLKIDLSPTEMRHLDETISSIYGKRGVRSEGQVAIDQATLIEFMSRDFYVKTLDAGNSVIAKQTLARVRLSLKAMGGQKSLESIVAPYLDEPLFPGQQQKVINIRSMKVFLMVVAARGLSSFEVENLVEYLDHDHNGFIGLRDFDKETNFTA